MPGFVNVLKACDGAGAKLFMSEQHSDVSIVLKFAERELRYPAHSLMLCCMSQVMKQMLELDMKEKATKKIVMRDSNPETIKHFLRFIYTGEMSVCDWNEVVELLIIAHKYQVDNLTSICEKKLLQSLTLTRVCALHEVARLYSLGKLKSETFKLILHSAFIVISTNAFETMSDKSLKEVLSNRLLNVEDELTVLNALKNWGKAECVRKSLPITEKNVINVITPLLKHIHFHLIPKEQRLLVPDSLISDLLEVRPLNRIKYFVPPLLHSHMTSLKFVVELGSYLTKPNQQFMCVRFSSDTSLYILGFRIVGMFKTNFAFIPGSPTLILSKDEESASSVQFDLGSVPWKTGSSVGEYVWREVVAYFPQPARADPFSCYSLNIKYGAVVPTKWPKTRMEATSIGTEFGSVSMYSFGQCAGITELFVIPAPSAVSSVNEL